MPHAQQFRPVHMPQQPMFHTFHSSFDSFEQENYQPLPSHHDNYAEFPEPAFIRKQVLKRSYSDVAPNSERPFKKPRAEEDVPTELPEPGDMPKIEDDGNKPSYSYAQMIGMAILRAPHRRLTLAQIYEWISSTFAFYREDTKQGWHNSIRHNLSLNKAFKKQERPKGDAGKGSYWIIEPGMETQFVKDKSRKGNNLSGITVHQNMVRQEPVAPPLAEALAPNPWLIEAKLPPRPQSAPALPDLSSDATVPASDPALGEEDVAEAEVVPRPQSPVPDAINSSPPIAAAQHRRGDSSPTRVRQSSSVRRKRTSTAMDDSGYFSSLESSVLRPNKSAVVLTSEIDMETRRNKTGRAEEEIQRIRSSSHDVTPSHGRFRNATNVDVGSSSPIRIGSIAKRNPMTPAVIFKKPMRPPQSVSPNTQLRQHRMAMQEFANSPVKSLGLYEHDVTTYSPMFRIPGGPLHNAFDEQFDVWNDPGLAMTPRTPAFGSSPMRFSVKRPSMLRANTSTTALSQITGNASRLNAKTPSKGPLLKSTLKSSFPGSPLKGTVTGNPTLDDQEDLFDFNSFAEDNDDDGEGLDILQGFGKIGHAAAQAVGLPANHARRPSLGARSFTTRY